MNKFLTTFLLSFIGLMANSQVTTNVQWTYESSLPAGKVIYYKSSQKLSWADFQAPSQNRGIVAAVTYSGFGYKADIKTVNGKSQVNVKVYCYFDKDKSWVKEGKTTDYILSHEQHHFDISFIAASIFIDKLQSAVFARSEINSRLQQIYQECIDAMDKMQNEYDTQTKNGQLREKQEEWSKRINSMLKQFSAIQAI